MLARLFVLVGGLAILVLAAALIAPYFIDWTNFRSQFEAEATRILGRPVRVAGSAEARLLPFPSVTFTDVRVGDPAREPEVRIERFSMDAELAPLLRGEILIFDMRLERPVLSLTLDEQGRLEWRRRSADIVDPEQVQLERISITDGLVTVVNRQTGRIFELTRIGAVVSADTLAGPWRAEGRAIAGETGFDYSVTTGMIDGGGAMRLRTRIVPGPYPVEIETEGNLTALSGVVDYSGEFRARSSAGEEESNASGLPDFSNYRASGEFTASAAGLQIPAYRFAAGDERDPYIVTGLARLDYGAEPSFAFEANGSQVRIAAAPDVNAEREGVYSALLALLDRIPTPGVPGEVTVNLPAFVAGDTLIRDIAVRASPEEGGWRLDRLDATLPGRTTLEASGTLENGDDPVFEGELLIASRQPSGFAAWLVGGVDEAIRRLPAAGFSANVRLSRQAQVFEGLEVVLGDASFAGRAERIATSDQGQPLVSVELAAGPLDENALRAFSALFLTEDKAIRMGDQQASVALSAGPVTAFGHRATSASVTVSTAGQEIKVNAFRFSDLDGADLEGSGTIAGLPGTPRIDVDMRVNTQDASLFVGRLAEIYPSRPVLDWWSAKALAVPDLAAPAAMTIAGSTKFTEPLEGAFSVNGTVGGIAVNATITSGQSQESSRSQLKLNASASAGRPAPILQLLGMEVADIGGGPEMSASLALTGTVTDGFDANLVVAAPEIRFDARGLATLGGGNFTFDGSVTFSAAEIDEWLELTGYALPGTGFGLPFQAKAAARSANGKWTLADMAGQLDGNAFSGTVAFDDTNATRIVSGDLRLDRLDLAWLFSLGTGTPPEPAGADGAWSGEPFGLPLLPGHTIDLRLVASGGETGWLGPATDLSTRFQYRDDRVSVTDLVAQTSVGRLSASADFQNSAGSGLASAQFRLEDAPLDAIAERISPVLPISGRLAIAGNLAGTGASPLDLVRSAAGSGVLTITDGAIAGVDAGAFNPLLARADQIGFGITPEQIRSIIGETVFSGVFSPISIETAFTIAGGIARTANVTLDAEGVSLTGDLALDLAERTVTADTVLAFDAGVEAVAGSAPEIGLALAGAWARPDLEVDYQPMEAYLTQRALEREQARVEAMQAKLLEKQRLRRELQVQRSRERTRIEAERQRIELFERDRQVEMFRSEEFRKSL